MTQLEIEVILHKKYGMLHDHIAMLISADRDSEQVVMFHFRDAQSNICHVTLFSRMD